MLMLLSSSSEEGRDGDGGSTALRGGIVKSVRDGMNHTIE